MRELPLAPPPSRWWAEPVAPASCLRLDGGLSSVPPPSRVEVWEWKEEEWRPSV